MHSVVRSAIPALFFSLLTACASVLPGTDGTEINPPPGHDNEISMAIDEVSDLSSERFIAYNVSFKNNSDRWIRLESTNIAFPQLSPAPEYLLGKDLDTYLKSAAREYSIRQHNKGLAIASIYALGAVGSAVGGATNNENLALAGAAASLGSLSYAGVDAINGLKNRAQFQGSLPESHLLKPFDIPPKMSVSRWIIVNVPQETNYREAIVELKEIGQEKRQFRVEQPLQEQKPTRRKG